MRVTVLVCDSVALEKLMFKEADPVFDLWNAGIRSQKVSGGD